MNVYKLTIEYNDISSFGWTPTNEEHPETIYIVAKSFEKASNPTLRHNGKMKGIELFLEDVLYNN